MKAIPVYPTRRRLLGGLLPAGLLLGAGGVAAAADSQAGVVYHLSDSARATGAIRNLENHRAADDSIEIAVVALAGGVEFLRSGAKDDNGNDYSALVEALSFKDIRFLACGNTLEALDIDPAELHFGVEVVPSGVAEIARLQNERGFAYIHP